MRITFFGGDARSVSAAVHLKNKGYDTSIYAVDGEVLEKFSAIDLKDHDYTGRDIIVFPLPFSRDGEHVNCPFSDNEYKITDVFKKLGKGARAFCGMARTYHVIAAKEYGVDLTDYYENEELQVKNAVPTSEGAIKIFMEHKDITLFGSKCVVSGCGTLGKCLADRLSLLGAEVTVTARNPKETAWAQTFGMKSQPLDAFLARKCDADCIFNTIPFNIFGIDFISSLPEETIYIELASKPYGMSNECSKLLGDRYIPALSLPGKYAPVSAGRIIAETVLKYI